MVESFPMFEGLVYNILTEYNKHPEAVVAAIRRYCLATESTASSYRLTVLDACNYEMSPDFYEALDWVVHSPDRLDVMISKIFINNLHRTGVEFIADPREDCTEDLVANYAVGTDAQRILPLSEASLFDLLPGDLLVPYIGQIGYWVHDRSKKLFMYQAGNPLNIFNLYSGTNPHTYDFGHWTSIISDNKNTNQVKGKVGRNPIITEHKNIDHALRYARGNTFSPESTHVLYCTPKIEEWVSHYLLMDYEDRTPRPLVSIYLHNARPVALVGKAKYISCLGYRPEENRIICGAYNLPISQSNIIDILDDVRDDEVVKDLQSQLDAALDSGSDLRYGYRRDVESVPPMQPDYRICRLDLEDTAQYENLTYVGIDPIPQIIRGFSQAFDMLSTEVIVEVPPTWNLEVLGNLVVSPRPIDSTFYGVDKMPEFSITSTPPKELGYYGCTLGSYQSYYETWDIKPCTDNFVCRAFNIEQVLHFFDNIGNIPRSTSHTCALWYDPHNDSKGMDELEFHSLKRKVSKLCAQHEVYWTADMTEDSYVAVFSQGESKYLRYVGGAVESRWMQDVVDISSVGNDVMVYYTKGASPAEILSNKGIVDDLTGIGLLVSLANPIKFPIWLREGGGEKPIKEVLTYMQNEYTWEKAWNHWARK